MDVATLVTIYLVASPLITTRPDILTAKNVLLTPAFHTSLTSSIPPKAPSNPRHLRHDAHASPRCCTRAARALGLGPWRQSMPHR
jgi:hypothetical protein